MDELIAKLFDHKDEIKDNLYLELMNCVMKAKVSILRITLHITNISLEFDFSDTDIKIIDDPRTEQRIIRYKNHSNTHGLDKFMASPFKPFRLEEHISRDDIEGLDGLFDTEEHQFTVEGSDLDDIEYKKISTTFSSLNIIYVIAVEEITSNVQSV